MFVTNIANNDIGVITPYQAQCGRIRKSLQDFEGIKVGSVEEFQGQVRCIWLSACGEVNIRLRNVGA